MFDTNTLMVHKGFVKIDSLNWKPIKDIALIKNEGCIASIKFRDGIMFDVAIAKGGILPLLTKLQEGEQ